jgi:hypothetical protein
MYGIRPLERKLKNAFQQGIVSAKAPLELRLKQALDAGVLTEEEIEAIRDADKLRYRAIQVDHFSNDFSEVLTYRDSTSIRTPTT